MNSVGGIQVFSAIKAKGTVLKTVPDFDALYEDEFYPKVIYYVASSATADELEDVTFLTDVTLSTDAKCLENATAAPVQEAPKPVAPVVEASEPVVESVVPTPVVSQTVPEEPVADDVSLVEKEVAAAQPKKVTPKANTTSQNSTVLRVDSKRIDYLLNLVSETVITKAAFNQTSIQVGDLQTQLQSIEASYKDKVHRLFEQIPRYMESMQNGATLKDVKFSLNQTLSP